jgi:hypothetical protein
MLRLQTLFLCWAYFGVNGQQHFFKWMAYKAGYEKKNNYVQSNLSIVVTWGRLTK